MESLLVETEFKFDNKDIELLDYSFFTCIGNGTKGSHNKIYILMRVQKSNGVAKLFRFWGKHNGGILKSKIEPDPGAAIFDSLVYAKMHKEGQGESYQLCSPNFEDIRFKKYKIIIEEFISLYL